jgi:hypothetical protein
MSRRWGRADPDHDRRIRVRLGLASETIYYGAGTPAYEVLLDLAIGWTYLYGGLACGRVAQPIASVV